MGIKRDDYVGITQRALDTSQSFPSHLFTDFRVVLTPPTHPFLHQTTASCPLLQEGPQRGSHLFSSIWLGLPGVAHQELFFNLSGLRFPLL